MKSKEQKEANKLKKKKAKYEEKEKLTTEEIQMRKKYKMNLLACLIYAVIIEAYFIDSNAISTLTSMQSFNMYVKISYMLFILIAVVMFEIAYKNEKMNFAITGIEFILLAIHMLLVGKIAKEDGKIYILSTSYIWPVYYCLKALIIYTKENKRRLKQISDIVEIVKEEKPTKKVAKKRKK